jgi:transposase
MNINELKKYINLHYSINGLSQHFNKGKSTIRYWLKKFKLKTILKYKKHDSDGKKKICIKCSEPKYVSDFYNNNTLLA